MIKKTNNQNTDKSTWTNKIFKESVNTWLDYVFGKAFVAMIILFLYEPDNFAKGRCSQFLTISGSNVLKTVLFRVIFLQMFKKVHASGSLRLSAGFLLKIK